MCAVAVRQQDLEVMTADGPLDTHRPPQVGLQRRQEPLGGPAPRQGRRATAERNPTGRDSVIASAADRSLRPVAPPLSRRSALRTLGPTAEMTRQDGLAKNEIDPRLSPLPIHTAAHGRRAETRGLMKHEYLRQLDVVEHVARDRSCRSRSASTRSDADVRVAVRPNSESIPSPRHRWIELCVNFTPQPSAEWRGSEGQRMSRVEEG